LGTLTVAGALRAATDEGFARTLKFWTFVLPIYAHYLLVQKQTEGLSENEAERAFNVLHDQYSPMVEAKTLEMRGYYLKAAQMMSTFDGAMPKQYLEWCRKLQDQVPVSMEPRDVERVIEKGLSGKLDNFFEEFDFNPIGSASIGQVYRAKLRSNGEAVAVKVQAEGIEDKFRADIGTIIAFCSFAMPQHLKPLKEIQDRFESEFDYVEEAINMATMYDKIMPTFRKLVAVPRPILEMCTAKVLVMEYLPGQSLLSGLRQQLETYAKVQGRDIEEVEKEQVELVRNGNAEDLATQARKMKLYQLSCNVKAALSNTAITLYNWTLGWVAAPKPYVHVDRLINLGEVLQILARVYGHQVLVSGFINGDPHPGNLMLLPDGRLGLIDYGQCRAISTESRLLYARLILALARDDEDAAVRVLHEAGYRTKYSKPEILYRLMQFHHNRLDDSVTGGLSMVQFLDWCESQDPLQDMNADFYFPGRVSVFLRGMGNNFGIQMRMAELWAPIADRVLHEEGQKGRDYL